MQIEALRKLPFWLLISLMVLELVWSPGSKCWTHKIRPDGSKVWRHGVQYSAVLCITKSSGLQVATDDLKRSYPWSWIDHHAFKFHSSYSVYSFPLLCSKAEKHCGADNVFCCSGWKRQVSFNTEKQLASGVTPEHSTHRLFKCFHYSSDEALMEKRNRFSHNL